MELIPNEDVYQIYKEDTGDMRCNPFLKLPKSPEEPPPLYISSKKQFPIIAQVFFGGISLVGLYIVYRLLEKADSKKSFF